MLVPRKTAGNSRIPCGSKLSSEIHGPRVAAESDQATPSAMPLANRNMIGTIPSTTPSTIASSVFAALLKKIAPASLTRGIPAKSFTKSRNRILKIVSEGRKPGNDYQADDKPGDKDGQARPQIRIEPHSVGAPFF